MAEPASVAMGDDERDAFLGTGGTGVLSEFFRLAPETTTGRTESQPGG